MTTTTRIYRAIPETGAGILLTKWTSGDWTTAYSRWKVIAPRTNQDMYIAGVMYHTEFGSSTDSTYETIIEIGFGKAGYEVVKLLLPHVMRKDTAVAEHYDTNIRLPEPFFVPKDTDVSVRMTSGTGTGQQTISGFRLFVMVDTLPIQHTEQVKLNNFLHVSAGNGISVTEKLR